jgi:hypothetical protein
MVPEDLLFWVDTFHPADGHDMGVLCRRHSDAMVVPRGWTLDDRREPRPRLFRPPSDASGGITRPARRRPAGATITARPTVEQLELRPAESDGAPAGAPHDVAEPVADSGRDPGLDHDPPTPWMPAFDTDDDLDGLLHADGPLLARAFRGTGRVR